MLVTIYNALDSTDTAWACTYRYIIFTASETYIKYCNPKNTCFQPIFAKYMDSFDAQK